MCGILCYINCECEIKTADNTEYDTIQWDLLESIIANRGPDSLANYTENLNEQWHGKFIGSVLWMQGTQVVSQPCTDDDGNILLWNGDIFTGPLASDMDCDTLTLLMKLKSSDNILDTINLIEGPFSIIYYHKSTNLLYFARDKIGRHSLLIKWNEERKSLLLCSVAMKNIDNIIELPAIGVFVANLQSDSISISYCPWNKLNEQLSLSLMKFQQKFHLNIIIESSICSNINDNLSQQNYEELMPLENMLDSNSHHNTMSNLLNNIDINKRVTTVLKLLMDSTKVRLKTIPKYCKNCIKHVITCKTIRYCDHPKIGILFSGGLDSTILAYIANEFIPANESIDLINVAFEKVRSNNVNRKETQSQLNYDVPDRKTGRQALNELKKIIPNRTWNFIEIDVTRVELQSFCNDQISNLIYPLQTVLDESLGCAVWFASRGSGILSPNNEYYESPCRILLLGMGADELFGGYTRHRKTFIRHGWHALANELNEELSRISERNLGRDDRVVSDHGRQSRLPYLDENLIRYVQSLNPWERCYLTEKFPPGLGDKLLLRLVAYKIGLRVTTNFPKRAFQFGSRIANSKQNANDISNWLR